MRNRISSNNKIIISEAFDFKYKMPEGLSPAQSAAYFNADAQVSGLENLYGQYDNKSIEPSAFMSVSTNPILLDSDIQSVKIYDIASNTQPPREKHHWISSSLGLLGSGLEAAAGAFCIAATDGLGAPLGCGVAFVHGMDGVYTSAKELWNGRAEETLTHLMLKPLVGDTTASVLDVGLTIATGGASLLTKQTTLAKQLRYQYYNWGTRLKPIPSEYGKSVFYSSASTLKENKQLAEAYATVTGKYTLEMTDAGKWLSNKKIYNKLPREYADKLWGKLSSRYAESAKGPVYAFVHGAKEEKIYYSIERGILAENKNVPTVFEFTKPLKEYSYISSENLKLGGKFISDFSLADLKLSTQAIKNTKQLPYALEVGAITSFSLISNKAETRENIMQNKHQEIQADNEFTHEINTAAYNDQYMPSLDSQLEDQQNTSIESLQKPQAKINVDALNKLLFQTSQHIEQIEFDTQLKALTSDTFTILANSAVLMGDAKAAQRLASVGQAGYTACSVIAGLKGAGILAGISPIAAGALLMTSLVTVISAFGRGNHDNTKVVMDAINKVINVIQHFQEEMLETFQEVTEHLDDISRDILFGFNEIQNNHTITSEKLELLQKKLRDYQNQAKYKHATVLDYLKNIDQKQKNAEFNQCYKKIDEAFIDAENCMTLDADKVSHLFTLLNGNTGCKATELTGAELNSGATDHPVAVTNLLSSYHWPILPIRSLITYNQSEQQDTFTYSKEQFDQIIAQLDIVPTLEVAKTHGLSELLLSNMENVPSLSRTIKTFIATDNQKILLVPLVIHGEYSLLSVSKNPLHIQYFGDITKHKRIQSIIALIAQVTEEKNEPFNLEKDCIPMPLQIPSDKRAAWIISIIKNLNANSNIINISTPEVNNQYDEDKNKFTKPLISTNNPINPMLWYAFTHRYLALLEKLSKTQQLVPKHMIQLQALIQDSDYTQHVIANTQNHEFFEGLVTHLAKATSGLKEALAQHLSTFIKSKTDEELKLALDENLHKTHRRELYHLLTQQKIKVRADYPCNTSFTENVALRDWGTTRMNINVPVKTIFAGFKSGLFDAPTNPEFGMNVFGNKLAKKYIKKQNEEITTQTNARIASDGLQKMQRHENVLNLEENKIVIETKSIPCAVLPLDSTLPLVFSNPKMATFIPDIYFNAQNLRLGELVMNYEIDETNRQFILISSFYCYETKTKTPVSIRKATFEPLFYDKAEGVWWFVMGGKCVLNTNDLERNEPYSIFGSHTLMHSYSPKTGERVGLVDRLDDLNETLDYQSQSYLAAEENIKQLIDKKIQTWHEEWQTQIEDVLLLEHSSPLGKAFANYNCTYNLLVKFIELAFPDEQREEVLGLMKKILMSNAAKIIDTDDNDFLMQLTKLRKPLLSTLPTTKEFNDLILCIKAKLQTVNHRDVDLLTQTEDAILNMLDKLLPNIKPEPQEEQTINISVATMQNAVDMCLSVDPNNPSAVIEMQKKMAMLMAMLNQNQKGLPEPTSGLKFFQPAPAKQSEAISPKTFTHGN